MSWKDKIADAAQQGSKGFVEQIKLLEDHMVQVQNNQVEFEQYLKEIRDNQNKIINAMKRLENVINKIDNQD